MTEQTSSAGTDEICTECGKPWSECLRNPAVLAAQNQRDEDAAAREWGAGRTFYEGTEIEPMEDSSELAEVERRYQVSKVGAADGRTWAIFDMTGDADTPAGIVDRRIFRSGADQQANALENLWRGIQESWPACEFIGCNEPSAAGSEFCAEHQAEHEENMRLSAENGRRSRDELRNDPTWSPVTGRTTDPIDLEALHAADIRNGMGLAADVEDPADDDDAYAELERTDEALVLCLALIGRQASDALEIDRSDEISIERLSAHLDGIQRLANAARRHLREIDELR